MVTLTKFFTMVQNKLFDLLILIVQKKKQPFGSKAKQFASDICFGKYVVVKSEGKKDRYNRIIAEIILQDDTNLNKELVKNGLAWHFKKYSDNQEYSELEISAKDKKNWNME